MREGERGEEGARTGRGNGDDVVVARQVACRPSEPAMDNLMMRTIAMVRDDEWLIKYGSVMIGNLHGLSNSAKTGRIRPHFSSKLVAADIGQNIVLSYIDSDQN